MQQADKTLIVVVGPTAIGKTHLAIELAQHFHTEIISADSRQFFKEMTIGTAKPTESELHTIRHHFINSQSIHASFSVGDFEQQGLQLLDELYLKQDIAILVGGSGLYVDAVCQGLDDIPKADQGIREKWNKVYAEQGIDELKRYLREIDLDYYHTVDLNNPQRLIRALEVYDTTGKPFSSYRIKNVSPRPFHIVKIGLNMSRDELYQRINHRVDLMMESGLLEEVKSLVPYKALNALNTVGYSELFEFLDGKITLETAVERIKQNTRRFAKRQLTWFKKQDDIQWFEPEQAEKIISYLNQQLPQSPGRSG